MPKIRGRIIRIVDPTTVIINLGEEDGIDSSCTFSILGSPEAIIDPLSGENLGEVTVVKGKVRASQVFDKFTIATTKWTRIAHQYAMSLLGFRTTEEVDEGELLVAADELQPWKAKSEEPVRVGDPVEVTVPDKGVPELEAEEGLSDKVSEEPSDLEGDSGD